MADRLLKIQSVAVIGAGISGVAAAIHLKRVGLDVTVYERTAKVGGIWVYDERTSADAPFPSLLPSAGDSPEFESKRTERTKRHDSPVPFETAWPTELLPAKDPEDISATFAPPGPCYVALKNNVSTVEMELSCQKWKPGTEEFVQHNVLAEYIYDAAACNGVLDSILFDTRVASVEKEAGKWRVTAARLNKDRKGTSDQTALFDGVVVASGHYHACNVPDIEGLAAWKKASPDRVFHSKLYRRPEMFSGQNVLLIGAGVSSMDIARDLGTYAAVVYQSSRGGLYDQPSRTLPKNAVRIGGIRSFSREQGGLREDGTIAGTVLLHSGETFCRIHSVIVCTGYHVSFPFLRYLHEDSVQPESASEHVLVTNGQQVHNLHKDIFYIPDPTLSMIGIPYHVATFSLFEHQAMALASVFSGQTALPSVKEMRTEYSDRVRLKGAGRAFHSLKDQGDETAYVRELVDMVNAGASGQSSKMPGHSKTWLEAYARRYARKGALVARTKDAATDADIIGLQQC